MADSVRASQPGLALVDRARAHKGWTKQVTVKWWETAHTSQATLKRFWQRKPIERQAFISICEAVGVDWETVAEPSTILETSPEPTVQLLTPEFYIDRPPIEACCGEILWQPGSLLRIKALRQMGKTWLLDRLLAQVAQRGWRSVNLSFKLAESRHFRNLDAFLRWFCTMVSRELQLPTQLAEFWEEEIGSKADCTSYFEEYLLPAADNPLVLGVDDVDLLFPYPDIYNDFFALLRFWHERAKSRPLWKKLRLVVVYSTEVYIPLNINQSPFNVGVPIELPEFTPAQVRDFAKLHGLHWEDTEIDRLMAMVGGHPYLLELAIDRLHSHPDLSLSTLLAMAPTDAGIYSNHLRQLLWELQTDRELASAFKTVVDATDRVRLEPGLAYKLDRMGLVRLSDNPVQPRCQLYRQYFGTYLGESG